MTAFRTSALRRAAVITALGTKIGKPPSNELADDRHADLPGNVTAHKPGQHCGGKSIQRGLTGRQAGERVSHRDLPGKGQHHRKQQPRPGAPIGKRTKMAPPQHPPPLPARHLRQLGYRIQCKAHKFVIGVAGTFVEPFQAADFALFSCLGETSWMRTSKKSRYRVTSATTIRSRNGSALPAPSEPVARNTNSIGRQRHALESASRSAI